MQQDVPMGVALITGSAQGIGEAIGLRLASDGFDVAINDVPSKLEQLMKAQLKIQEMGRKCEVFPADASEEEQIKGMIESTVDSLGSLDVFVANAGVSVLKALTETSTAELDRLLAGRGGRIIGASSIAGKQGMFAGSAYSGTKFAVRGFTQSSALELAKYGITVNAYAPAAIDTDMLRVSLPQNCDESTEKIIRAKWTEDLPVKRLGNAEDIAGLVSYLASKESSFITGQTISINGGLFFD